MSEETSLKQLFQGMVVEGMSVIEGKVLSHEPLKIQVINDEKLIIHKNITIVPRHLTQYTTKVDIALDEGVIDSSTKSGLGTHGHGPSGEHSQASGSGSHTHPNSEGAHVHSISTFAIKGATMTVYNGLKKGDIVSILSFNHGKKYYVLDREG